MCESAAAANRSITEQGSEQASGAGQLHQALKKTRADMFGSVLSPGTEATCTASACLVLRGTLLGLPGRQALLHLLQPRGLGGSLLLLGLLLAAVPASQEVFMQVPVTSLLQGLHATRSLMQVPITRVKHAQRCHKLCSSQQTCSDNEEAGYGAQHKPTNDSFACRHASNNQWLCKDNVMPMTHLAALASASPMTLGGASVPPTASGACDSNGTLTTRARARYPPQTPRRLAASPADPGKESSLCARATLSLCAEEMQPRGATFLHQ